MINYEVIRYPIITEKALYAIEKSNCYVFKVLNSATKHIIKKTVEEIFSVKVKKVNVLNRYGKQKRFKNVQGKRNDSKIAYVTLESGFKIDLNLEQ